MYFAQQENTKHNYYFGEIPTQNIINIDSIFSAKKVFENATLHYRHGDDLCFIIQLPDTHSFEEFFEIDQPSRITSTESSHSDCSDRQNDLGSQRYSVNFVPKIIDDQNPQPHPFQGYLCLAFRSWSGQAVESR